MSKRDPEIALRQILEHAREAVEIWQSKERSDLDSDRLLNLALTRLIENEKRPPQQEGASVFGHRELTIPY